jgi:hypothetical protein
MASSPQTARLLAMTLAERLQSEQRLLRRITGMDDCHCEPRSGEAISMPQGVDGFVAANGAAPRNDTG